MSSTPRQAPAPANDDQRYEEVFAHCRTMTGSELKSEGLANVVRRVTAAGETLVLTRHKAREVVILNAQAWAEQQLELQRLRDALRGAELQALRGRFQNRLDDPAVREAIDRDLMGGMKLDGTLRVGDSY